MRKRVKWQAGALLTTIAMLLLVLAGCSGGGNNEAAGTTEASASPSAGGASPQASVSASPSAELPPVTLTWYMRAAEPKNADAVLAKANEILKDKINATLEIKWIAPGDYDQKMQLVMSSNEAYDIAYTAAWTNNYLNNVSKGAYLSLDDLLAQYPDLQGLFKKEVWDSVRVGGKIYAIPSMQNMAGQNGLWFKKDLVDKYQIDLSAVKTTADLTPIYQKIKDGEPGVSPLRQGINNMFVPFAPQIEGFAVDMSTGKVYDPVPTDYVDNYRIFRDWYQKGFFPQDVATLKDEAPLIKAGKIFSRYTSISPGVEASLKTQYGFDVDVIPYSDKVTKQGTVQAALNAISATSKNPDRAMMLLNLVNTDKDLFNLLAFGIEGEDYTRVSDTRIEPISGGYTASGYMFGNVFNGYLTPGQADDVWEQTKQNNDAATVDPLIGFSFDRTSVENELAQITAVRTETDPVLNNGLDDVDKTLKLRDEKMKAAGVDKVIAEIQKQLDAWKANNP